MNRAGFVLILAACCGPAAAPTPTPASAPQLARIPLDGAGSDGAIGMDYLAYDAHTHAVWVPAGNSGAVDVIDTATRKVTKVAGFATKTVERDGKTRVVGPSSATVGDGVVYVGNRGDSSICAVSDTTLAKGACVVLDASPDGIAYIAASREVWATTPRDKSLRILDAATLAEKAKLPLADGPEGFAVDHAHGRFFTNVAGKATAFDVATHAQLAAWATGCGDEEPHGLRFDDAAGWLVVACSSKLAVLDTAHGGAVLGTVATGDGIDDIDYDPAAHRVYAAAGRAGTLTVAELAPTGAARVVATIPTAPGARNGVVSDRGVFIAHGPGAEILVVATP